VVNTVKRKAILFILDGFRTDYVFRVRRSKIREMAEKGAGPRYAWSIFPSMTHPAHTSIITGLYPQAHGCFSQHYLDVQRGVKRDPTCYNRYRGSPLPELLKKMNGKTVSIEEFTCIGKCDLYINIPSHSVEEIVYYAKTVLRREKPDLLIITFFITDDIGTLYGPESNKIAEAIREVDDAINEVIDYAEEAWKKSSKLYIITSDHGMTYAGNNVRRNIEETIETADFLHEGHYTHVYLRGRRIPNKICLSTLIKGVDVVFEKEELGFLNNYDPYMGDFTISLKEGYNTYGSNVKHRGVHGGFTDDEMQVPLIIYGDYVKEGASLRFAEIVDVAPTLAAFFGFNGSFDGRPLAEAFTVDEERRLEILKETAFLDMAYRKIRTTLRKLSEIKGMLARNEITRREYYAFKRNLNSSVRKLKNEFDARKQALKKLGFELLREKTS